MKVIMAGLPKTGTKTMHAAFDIIGYSVYDIMEHFWLHGDQWNKFWSGKGTIADLEEMYKDVDTCVDGPIFYYWEELLQAFPDAKIILTIRDEDQWWKSMQKQVENMQSNKMFSAMMTLSPTGHRYLRFVRRMMMVEFGSMFDLHDIIHGKNVMNEMICRRTFRQSNLYVMQKAPKTNLLVYKVSDGWEPLCKFLDVPVPNVPFPHKNARGGLLETLKEHPVFLRMRRETILSLGLILTLCVYGIYKAYTMLINLLLDTLI
nr:uncharacterized protein LOC100181848 [Ciona intestinalis]|eukprot:XP_002122744.1 uncharacterized protein LOC100181848 [Ciona intestinalis]